jgi:4-amino-4-deoxy-L-arabinose transferase-like glycosyltransferase
VRRRVVLRSLIALDVALLFACAFAGLGSPAAGTHPDEATYLAIVQEMQAKDSWLTPYFEGERNWFKPPLLYIAQRASLTLFGDSLWAARLPVAMCTVLLALSLGILASSIYGKRGGRLATLFAASTLGFLRFGHLGMMDVPLALCLTWVAIGAWRATYRRDAASWLISGVAAGLGILLKGPVAAFLALGLAVATAWVHRAPVYKERWFWLGSALALAVAAPWFVATGIEYPDEFWQAFVVREHFAKFQGVWSAAQSLEFAGALFVIALPWSIVALRAFSAEWKVDRSVWFALWWIVIVAAVYSVPSVKHPHYWVCAIPAVILLATAATLRADAKWFMALPLAVTAATLCLLLRLTPSHVGSIGVTLAGLLCLIGAAMALGEQFTSSLRTAAMASAVLMAMVLPYSTTSNVDPMVLREWIGNKPIYSVGQSRGVDPMLYGVPFRRAADFDTSEYVVSTKRAVETWAEGAKVHTLDLATWTRFRPKLTLGNVLNAWRAADVTLLQEEMQLTQLQRVDDNDADSFEPVSAVRR